MRLDFAYPSVPVFPQSSILLQKGEGRDSTPTETAPGAFLIVAAQPLKALGAQLRIERESSNWLRRVDEKLRSLFGSGSLSEILWVQVLPATCAGVRVLRSLAGWIETSALYWTEEFVGDFMGAGSTCGVGVRVRTVIRSRKKT